MKFREKGFDLELWNEFLEHPDDFEAYLDEEIEAMKGRASFKKWDDKVKAHFNKEIGKLNNGSPNFRKFSYFSC